MRLEVLMAWLLGAALAPAAQAGGTVRINDTGKTLCVDASGLETASCSGSGQDAEYGRDVAFPSPKDGPAGYKFAKVCNSGEVAGKGSCPSKPVRGTAPNDWGCTQDVVTGLLWSLHTTESGPFYYYNTYTNLGNGQANDASGLVNLANQMPLCGHADWRVPHIDELLGLRSFQGAGFDPNWFPDSPEIDRYWASENFAPDAPVFYNAWFDSAGFASFNPREQANQVVRLVSGATPTRGSFKVNGAEATDAGTGLVWRRCMEGQTWSGTTCVGTMLELTWRQALQRAADERQRTGVAWRVPNYKELLSINDLSRFFPALNMKAFPKAPTNNMTWSSTHRDAVHAWITAMGLAVGSELLMDQHTAIGVRLVRDAP